MNEIIYEKVPRDFIAKLAREIEKADGALSRGDVYDLNGYEIWERMVKAEEEVASLRRKQAGFRDMLEHAVNSYRERLDSMHEMNEYAEALKAHEAARVATYLLNMYDALARQP